jgi:hypothetical protein
MGRARDILKQCLLNRLALVVGLWGCTPEIGDSCNTSVDCSPAGDRLCDTTQPGGYCTIYNCEDTTDDEADAAQGACPEEAACVVYAPTPSARCEEPEGDAPYQRTFCMLRCENDTDCRTEDGYHCIDVAAAGTYQWHAIVIHPEGSNPNELIKVCSQHYDGRAVPESRSTEVCTGTSRTPAE